MKRKTRRRRIKERDKDEEEEVKWSGDRKREHITVLHINTLEIRDTQHRKKHIFELIFTQPLKRSKKVNNNIFTISANISGNSEH